MGYSQYLAYKRDFGHKIPIRTSRRGVKGIAGKTGAIDEVTIQIPITDIGIIIHVEFSVLPGDTPSLLSNKDMIESGLDFGLQSGCIHVGDKRKALHLGNYFYIHRCPKKSILYVMFTEKELRLIHRSFGHPSVSSNHKFLRKESSEPLSKTLRMKLVKLADSCKTCKRNAEASQRFKLTVGSEDLAFNSKVLVDTMFLDGRPVIHIFDEDTHFSAAAFLKSQLAESIWTAILKLWTHTYLGPSEFLAVDEGTNYLSR